MMGMIVSALKKFLFWSYDRGSWQYDVLCALILAFIFFGPNSVFHSADGANAAPVFVKIEDVGLLEPGSYNQAISDFYLRKYNRKVKATNIEPMLDSDGNLKGYLVKEINQ
jgi:hypothetical protein